MACDHKELYAFDGYTLDVAEHLLLRGTEHVAVSEKTFETLCVLVRNAGRLVTKDELMRQVWTDSFVEENNLDKNISLLRQALGEKKGEMKFIRTVRGQGYRFVADVTSGSPTEPVTPQLVISDSDAVMPERRAPEIQDAIRRTGDNQKTRRALFIFAAVALCLTIAAGLYFTWGNVSTEPKNSASVDSIAVLPFENDAQGPDAEYLSDGISESLINRLSQISNLKVMSRSAVSRYKGVEQDAQKVGGELSVRAVLSGSVNQLGDQMVVTVRLDDARNGQHIWGEQYVRKLADILTVQSEIARDVTSKLKIRLSGAEQEKLTKNYTQNPDAYQLYLKGIYYWNKYPAKEYEKSREYYQQAIDVDPKYALAYSGLSDYYGYAANNGTVPPGDNWSKAEAAAEKALMLDDSLGEAHNSLAAVRMYFYHDWEGAEREFERALESNPNSAEAHQLYGGYLIIRGRSAAGLDEKKKAVEIEPMSLRLNRQLGRAFYWIRDYDGAIDQYRKTLELDSNDAYTHELLGDALEKKELQKEAVAEWSRALRLNDEQELAATLDRTFLRSGFGAAVRSLWQKRTDQFKEKSNSGRYLPAMNYALAYTRLGDKEKAFAWLAKAEPERNRLIFDLKLEPIYDTLKTDTRFGEIMGRAGL
ncbi:MAG: winged helix-turn-helix domain-containing protein [Pyrinomonadaceae bacterium]